MNLILLPAVKLCMSSSRDVMSRRIRVGENLDYEPMLYRTKVLLVVAFAVAMAYIEAATMVYLRELFFPEGLSLPLDEIPGRFLRIELIRQTSALIILAAAAILAGRIFWERVGWFLVAFGLWDIFFYVWLKLTLGWPMSLFESDVLFLIPVPWVGPVIAPMFVALFLIVIGLLITILYARGFAFHTTTVAWIAVILGTIALLYSFMRGAGVTLPREATETYPYWLLLVGLGLYLVGFWHAWHASINRPLQSS